MTITTFSDKYVTRQKLSLLTMALSDSRLSDSRVNENLYRDFLNFIVQGLFI